MGVSLRDENLMLALNLIKRDPDYHKPTPHLARIRIEAEQIAPASSGSAAPRPICKLRGPPCATSVRPIDAQLAVRSMTTALVVMIEADRPKTREDLLKFVMIRVVPLAVRLARAAVAASDVLGDALAERRNPLR